MAEHDKALTALQSRKRATMRYHSRDYEKKDGKAVLVPKGHGCPLPEFEVRSDGETYFQTGKLSHGVPMLFEVIQKVMPEVKRKVGLLSEERRRHYVGNYLPNASDHERELWDHLYGNGSFQKETDKWYVKTMKSPAPGKAPKHHVEVVSRAAAEKASATIPTIPELDFQIWIGDLNTSVWGKSPKGHNTHNAGRNFDVSYYYSNNGEKPGFGTLICNEWRYRNIQIYREPINGRPIWQVNEKEDAKGGQIVAGQWLLPGNRTSKGWTTGRKLIKCVPDWDIEANYILFSELANFRDDNGYVVEGIMTDVFYDNLLEQYFKGLLKGLDDNYQWLDKSVLKKSATMPSTKVLVERGVIRPVQREYDETIAKGKGRNKVDAKKTGADELTRLKKMSQNWDLHDHHFHVTIPKRFEREYGYTRHTTGKCDC